MVACSQCGARAASTWVAEELWLLGQDEVLHTRLEWVHARVAAGDAPSDQALVVATRPAGAQEPAPVAAQTLLLAGGALLLVIASAVFAAVAWSRLGPAGQVGLMLAVVALLTVSAEWLSRSYAATAEALAAVAASVAAIALIAAPSLGLGSAWMEDRPAAWAALALAAVAVFCAALAIRSKLLAWHAGLVVATWSAFVVGAVAASDSDRIEGSAVLLLALAATTALLVARRASARWRIDLEFLGAGLAAAAAAGAWLGALPDGGVAWVAIWLTIAGGAWAVHRAYQGVRPATALIAALALGTALAQALAAAVAPADDPTIPLVVLAVGGAALAAAGLALRDRGSEWVAAGWVGFGVAAAAAVTGAQPYGGAPATDWALHLALVAAALFALSLARGQHLAAWFGAAAGSGAVAIMLAQADVTTLEAYTAPMALLLLAAGLVLARAHRDAGSLAVLGPALAMLVLPSALLAAGQASSGDGAARTVAVLSGSALLALLGARVRVLAAFAVGLAGAVIAGLGQLSAWADLLPRWVVLGVCGALLVAAGFEYERLGQLGRSVGSRARTMR